MGDVIETDVLIVGAGIAGSLVAAQLAAAGARVLVLESGPSQDRSEAVGNFRSALAKTPESAYADVAYAPRPTVIDLKGYYVQEGPDLFSSTYERRVGGTTWHWLGTCLRLIPSDFRLASAYGVGVDWPVSYAELEPWYGAAEQAIGVAGDDAVDLGTPRSAPFPLPPIPPSYLDQRVSEAARQIGLAVVPTPAARNSMAFDGRPACCGNHMCIPVCPIQAKYDASVHVAKATAAGAQIMEQAIAHRVEAGSDGLIRGIRFLRPDGSEERAVASVYVLAAHAIETAKLLLISRTAAFPNGVANTSDQVGRNLMDHPTQLSWALTNEPVYPYRGPLSTSGIEQLRDGDFRSSRGAYRIEIGNDGWSWPVGDLTQIAADMITKEGLKGQALIQTLQDRSARHIRMASLVEQLPDPNNRITPAWDQLDALGIPRPRIHYQVDDYTRAGMADARQVHQQIYDALGATQVQFADDFFGAGHIMGTFRMGRNPRTSVVDRNLRSHDHANLFLLGSGVFPSVGCSNPTLTIAALALRAAATIQGDLGR